MTTSSRARIFRPTLRRALALGVVALVAVSVAGCGDDGANGSEDPPPVKPTGEAGLAIGDLRDASSCPVEFDAAELPDGLMLGEPEEASVTEYGDGVGVDCDFPVEGSEDDVITATLVAAPSGTDLFEMDSESGGTWVNGVYNSTGVDKQELEDTANDLSDDDIEVLEGRSESVAITRMAIADDGAGLLVVAGGDGRSDEDVEAVAEALR